MHLYVATDRMKARTAITQDSGGVWEGGRGVKLGRDTRRVSATSLLPLYFLNTIDRLYQFQVYDIVIQNIKPTK